MALEKATLITPIKRIGILAAVVIAFALGLAGTVYLSLRSPEVKVPEVVGKHYVEGQTTLEDAGLNIRKRMKRFKPDAQPDTILDQSPRTGEVVKSGQTVAVVVADENSGKESDSAAGETEAGETPKPSPTPAEAPANRNANNDNREQRNRNANRNTNRNSNRNSNRNANDQNSNNSNRNANRNANRNTNANNRNANAAGNRNADALRNTNNANRNANRRPPVTLTSPSNSSDNMP